ncbi:TIGR04282 family arsenosugar biosynthesis glycosyltransferase [Geojedonia litorea]|uniref:TIGR04282 family arsenosugar biosynthesis glycosyltransferase n=1 Tax=Geojedonia litorea TaxID=1268269 RepID=A0ABV9N6U0_9FLAO
MGQLSNRHSEKSVNTSDFIFQTPKRALIVFTRNPELGKCKTRLAKTIGNKAALEIYIHLLKHTCTITKPVTAVKFVFYSETISPDDLWDSSIFRKKLQSGEDLGSRMQNAFSELFELGYEHVMIIGSDLLELSVSHIENAFKHLHNHDLVIGPAKDGGYYLLAMKKLHESIFKNKNWGTASVLNDTLNDLNNFDVKLIEELNDIDTFEDIKDNSELQKYFS